MRLNNYIVVALVGWMSALLYHEEMSLVDNFANQLAHWVAKISPMPPEYQLEYPRDADAIKWYRSAANGLMRLVMLACNSQEEVEFYWTKSSRKELTIEGGPNGPVDIIVVTPPLVSTELLPLVVYYHGGGMVTGLPEEGNMVRLVSEANAVVVGVDYRLAPEHPYPAGVKDCYYVLQYMVENAKRFGIDEKRVAVSGLSAGGLMAAVVAAISTHGYPQDPSVVLKHPLQAQILFQPVLSYPGGGYQSYIKFADVGGLPNLRMQWFWHMYASSNRNCTTDFVCSPFAQSHVQLANLPPLFIQTASADVLRDEGRHYAELVRSAGVSVFHRESFGSHLMSPILDTGATIQVTKMGAKSIN